MSGNPKRKHEGSYYPGEPEVKRVRMAVSPSTTKLVVRDAPEVKKARKAVSSSTTKLMVRDVLVTALRGLNEEHLSGKFEESYEAEFMTTFASHLNEEVKHQLVLCLQQQLRGLDEWVAPSIEEHRGDAYKLLTEMNPTSDPPSELEAFFRKYLYVCFNATTSCRGGGVMPFHEEVGTLCLENEGLRQDKQELRLENEGLRQDKQELRLEKEQLRLENEQLLKTVRQYEGQKRARKAYVKVKRAEKVAQKVAQAAQAQANYETELSLGIVDSTEEKRVKNKMNALNEMKNIVEGVDAIYLESEEKKLACTPNGKKMI